MESRRSGFNVRRFERNYINTANNNVRFGPVMVSLQMENYYVHLGNRTAPKQMVQEVLVEKHSVR